MTDKEWIAQIKIVSNKELLNALENCGYDSYYGDIYSAILEELQRRLNGSDAIPMEWIMKYYEDHPAGFVTGMIYDWAMEQAEREERCD